MYWWSGVVCACGPNTEAGRLRTQGHLELYTKTPSQREKERKIPNSAQDFPSLSLLCQQWVG